MSTLANLLTFLESFAPLHLSEEWDNTGLLIGDRFCMQEISSIMTCLTLTPDVAEEAVSQNANLIITHHPILFRPVQRLTSETSEGSMILQLIKAGIAIYSPHTSYDSAQEGINQQIAESIALTNIGILRPAESISTEEETPCGTGRFGDLKEPQTLSALNEQIKQVLQIDSLQFVGQLDTSITRIGIACGAAAELMHDALNHNCQALLTGEARFHASLEARTLGIALVIAGHYATERPAMERLAKRLQVEFSSLKTWCSNTERDPVNWG
ncbi:hypothetical protein MNBD_PLANCTO02-1367 [hydrothermal vent metagenome]|uniref:GTP cyclohydrolase 1 type 2 homolog YbgI n=1 Tax=hydrothermal vent metagenome TaxID=652676 RepID=A0A3B1DQS6_9ZZZZ